MSYAVGKKKKIIITNSNWNLVIIADLSLSVDIYDDFKATVKPDELNVTTSILGGGWLEHGDKSILVEGVSVVSVDSLS